MQIDIKCAECGKMTRHFELGKVCYSVENPSETFRVVDEIICPKCKNNISNEKCLIKSHEMVLKILVANISIVIGENQPKHLRGVIRDDAGAIKAKSKPRIVEKF